MPSSSFVHNTTRSLSEDSVRFLTEPSHTHSQTPCELLGREPCPGVPAGLHCLLRANSSCPVCGFSTSSLGKLSIDFCVEIYRATLRKEQCVTRAPQCLSRTHMGGRHHHSDLSFFCIFETGSCCVSQTGLELGDPPSSASVERHVPPCLVLVVF